MLSTSRVSRTIIESSTSEAMLIIGKGETEYKNTEIIKATELADVQYMYGKNSDLTKAFEEAMIIGANNVYLCNCYKFTDYISTIDDICKRDFAFIIPLYDFSQTFTLNENTSMYLCEFYSNMLDENTTQIFVTDKHASLYENLDHYLINVNNTILDFKNKSKLLNGNNICFVSNILKEYRFANVALASILQISDLKYYPQKDIGDVVFDLNSLDFNRQEVTYFAYDINSKTTIENFFNFSKENNPAKFVPLNIIMQRIKKSLDMSDFHGKLFNPYMRVAIENKVNNVMQSHVGSTIEKYTLQNIRVSQTQDRSIKILIAISIKPYNSIETINLEMEI